MNAGFLSPFDGRLLAERDGGRAKWMLLAPLRYWSARLGREIVVPAGFITDGESVPSQLAGLTGPACLQGGALHDWLYQKHETTKDEADHVYREALESMALDAAWCDQRFGAVSFYGASAYASGPRRCRIADPSAPCAERPYGILPAPATPARAPAPQADAVSPP